MKSEEISLNDPEQGQGLETCEVEEKEKQACGRSGIVCISATVVGSIIALYGLIFLISFGFQGKLLYQPSICRKYFDERVEIFGRRISEESEYLSRTGGWRVIELKTEDGVTLNNIWIHANTGYDYVPVTILYLHGNAGRIDNSLAFVNEIHRRFNCNVFMLSYRGYGLSTGSPDEKGLKIDAQTALNWILENVAEKDNERIVVLGRSLGGAVAIDLVSKNTDRVNGLIVENTFLSIPKLAGDLSVFLRPFVSAINQVFDSANAIQKITAPILFLSGADDKLIPPAHMKKLQELATKSKTKFIEYPDSGHNDTFLSNNYFHDIVKFLKTIK